MEVYFFFKIICDGLSFSKGFPEYLIECWMVIIRKNKVLRYGGSVFLSRLLRKRLTLRQFVKYYKTRRFSNHTIEEDLDKVDKYKKESHFWYKYSMPYLYKWIDDMINTYCNEIKIADRPICCWKLMERDKNTNTYFSVSPNDSLFGYKLGERIKIREELRLIIRSGICFVNSGIRSYRVIPECMKNLPFMSAIIPEGSKYVEGADGEYASEEIIIGEI